MFQVNSSRGRMLLSENKTSLPSTNQKASSKGCLSLGRCLFFLSVLILAVIVIMFTYFADIIGLSSMVLQPTYVKVTLEPFKPNTAMLNTSFQSAITSMNISVIDLPVVEDSQRSLFQYGLSEKDLRLLVDALQSFHEIMTAIPIPYFLYKGSLLGSYRHHSIIPWDDDLDLLVHANNKEKMKKEFAKRAPSQFKLDTSTFRFKYYSTAGNKIKKSWRSPFLDVSFYKENATYLWDITLPTQKPFLKANIFPLTDRPLLGHMYPSPKDPLKVLQVTYNIDNCYTGTYNHTSEKTKNKKFVATVPCAALLDMVPFVQHARGPGGAWCAEMLTFRGEVISTFLRDAKDIPVC